MSADSEKIVCQALSALGIPYLRHEHPPVFTVAEARQVDGGLPGERARCLFLRSKNGARHYLVILEEARPLDLKQLARQVGESGLGLASAERLSRCLGVTPGAVGPFGLLNDPAQAVTVLLDDSLPRAEWIGFHPNLNTVTLLISGPGLVQFLAWRGNPCQILSF